ncbi:MAG: hypothetical protein A4S09_11485 [Proteobacteria bacterium SG_bin7]|nr:MAG: hypothetical protein A4S09_11485 [Proteobacteria bacterium SG_bin7]
MKTSLVLLFLTLPIVAISQESSNQLLVLGLTYSQMNYEEPGAMTEKGGNGGVQGEFFYGLGASWNVSVFGGYWDGRLFYDGATFSGTPVQTITRDYIADARLYLNANFSPFQISIGYGRRFWYNDMVISYRRRTEYNFVPIILKYTSGSIYYRVEYDIWAGGLNRSHMSDTGGGRTDVEFKQNSGTGFGGEVGWMFGSNPATIIFLNLHRWDVEASETGFDGVDLLVEPKNNTQTITLGIGLGF